MSVCVVPDEAVEAAAKALVMSRTNGCCDEWPKPCADCDCFRDQHPEIMAGYERAHAHAALAAALPVLRAVDGWAERERQLRDEIADEILAHASAYGDGGVRIMDSAAWIARGGGSHE